MTIDYTCYNKYNCNNHTLYMILNIYKIICFYFVYTYGKF